MSDRLIGKSAFFGSVVCLFESSSLSTRVHSSMVEQVAFNYSVGSSNLPGPKKLFSKTLIDHATFDYLKVSEYLLAKGM